MSIFAGMDAVYMQRCFQLAREGAGYTSPNPLVGCVIVEKNQIIGEGYHRAAGEPHAEVHAIESVKDRTRLRNATLYVNLEPCAHHGRTPPCAPLIVQHKIPRVVIANRDPFDEVNGKGIAILEKAGIAVTTGCEASAGAELNRRFFTFHQKKRPFVVLKLAQSANGFIDRSRTAEERGVNWITQPSTQYLTHKWRSREDAIMVGTRTALTDNPTLSVRRIVGLQPHRLLIDRSLRVPPTAKIFGPEAPTTVFNASVTKQKKNVNWVKLDFSVDIVPQVLQWMYAENLQSLLVEGGADTISRFVKSEQWDEARLLTGNITFTSGIPTPKIGGELVDSYHFGDDRVTVMRNPL